MRTNWAGSSMTIAEISEAYQPVIGPVAERLRRSDGNQPGDLARIARCCSISPKCRRRCCACWSAATR